MNNQDKKNYLNSYRELIYEANRLKDFSNFWKEKAANVSSVNLNNFGIRSTSRPIMSPIDKSIDLASQYSELCAIAFMKQMEISEAINSLENRTHRMVLNMHYIDGLTFKEIAQELKYSDWRIYHIHLDALKLLEIPENRQTVAN